MDATQLNTCREAAAKCRQEALSSADPEQWIDLAEEWERLADTTNGTARELAQLEKICHQKKIIENEFQEISKDCPGTEC